MIIIQKKTPRENIFMFFCRNAIKPQREADNSTQQGGEREALVMGCM